MWTRNGTLRSPRDRLPRTHERTQLGGDIAALHDLRSVVVDGSFQGQRLGHQLTAAALLLRWLTPAALDPSRDNVPLVIR